MALRTEEKLQQLFQERKRIQQRKKEREKIKYKKASEAIKKALQHNSPPKENKCNQEPKNSLYDVPIYNSHYVQRETAEEDLYTKEELENIEELYPNETGRIDWDFFNDLVERTKRKTLAE